MNEDWKLAVSRIAYWKQIAHDHDKFGAFPWHLPHVAADESQIADAGKAVGFDFPSEFRTLLSVINGWKGFYMGVDLFGTDDFISGRSLEIKQREEISDFIQGAGFPAEEVIVIGASEEEIDTFILISDSNASLPGGVLWWAGDEIDRFPGCKAFFEAMVNYNAHIANKLTQDAQ
jgi:hypothetical protein